MSERLDRCMPAIVKEPHEEPVQEIPKRPPHKASAKTITAMRLAISQLGEDAPHHKLMAYAEKLLKGES